MIDLGAKACIPCKMMAPILEKLEKDYRGRAAIIFIDVWKDKEPAQRYGIRAIPTQIFFDKEGQGDLPSRGVLERRGDCFAVEENGRELNSAVEIRRGFYAGVVFPYGQRMDAGGTAIAALGCFLWGMISVLFSPCHLASIPLIVAYVGGQQTGGQAQGGRALFGGLHLRPLHHHRPHRHCLRPPGPDAGGCGQLLAGPGGAGAHLGGPGHVRGGELLHVGQPLLSPEPSEACRAPLSWAWPTVSFPVPAPSALSPRSWPSSPFSRRSPRESSLSSSLPSATASPSWWRGVPRLRSRR